MICRAILVAKKVPGREQWRNRRSFRYRTPERGANNEGKQEAGGRCDRHRDRVRWRRRVRVLDHDGVRYGRRSGGGTSDWNAAFARTRSEGFGGEVKRRILLGTFVLSAGYYEAYYVRAQKVRALLAQEFALAFKRFDVLLGPTMPVLPPKVGEKVSPLEDYLMDVYTVAANLTGLPAISIPCGHSQGLPVGMQMIAPGFREDILLDAACDFGREQGVKSPPVMEAA